MPAKKKPPSYRLHRPSGQAVVRIDSHDHYLGRHGTPESHEKYARLVAEWSASGQVIEPASDHTVNEVLVAYLTHAQTYYVKDGEQTNEVGRIRRALAPARKLYGSTPARDFGPKALKACRACYVTDGHVRDQVNKLTRCLVRCFRWAAGEEMVPGETWHALQAVEGLRAGRSDAPESDPVLPAPRDAIDAVLAVISPVLADVIRLQLLTGARPGEAVRLRACELERSGDVWLWHPRRHKTQHRRREKVMFAGPQAQALLSPYLERMGDGYLFSPRDSMRQFRERQRAARKTPVQPSQQDRSRDDPARQPGERYKVESYCQAVTKACVKAGCERFTPHALRHTAATELVAQFGWEVGRVILGHRSVDMTREYAEDSQAKAVEAMRTFG